MTGEQGANPSDEWRKFLTGDPPPRRLIAQRSLFRHLPSPPHCKLCEAPFKGPGAAALRPFGFRPWPKSPQFCQICRRSLAKLGMGGAEVDISIMFADLRGSTSLGEQLGAAAFGQLLNRYYLVADAAITAHKGIVSQHQGDGVIGLFLPVFAGDEHAGNAVRAARAVIAGVTGHDGVAWAPVGIGVASGESYVGVVSTADEPDDFTALGDVVNTAARLASAAQATKILISRATADAAGVAVSPANTRMLSLKGKSDPVEAIVLSG